MKRGNRAKLQGFLLKMKNRYQWCKRNNYHAEARYIRAWLSTHTALLGVKNDAA